MNANEFFATYAENMRRAFETNVNSVDFDCKCCPLREKCRADASAGIKEELTCAEYIRDSLAG